VSDQAVQPWEFALKVAVNAAELNRFIFGGEDANGVARDNEVNRLVRAEGDVVHARIDDRPAENVKGLVK
jgi:hypothetical protein